MPTLYLDRRGLTLRLDGAAAAIYLDGHLAGRVPLIQVERVVISAETSLSTSLLTALAGAGAPVVIVNPRDRSRVATLLGGPRPDSERRVAQYRAFLNQEWRTAWSRRQVTGKLKGQARLLRAAASERPALKHDLLAAAETISSIRESVAGAAGAGREHLMGWEGAGSAAFFRAYPLLFAPALGFHQRNRRPPRDPVNAALSLGYTMAHVTAVAEIHKAGLDPYLGYFHEPLPGRESLACDVIEPYRPRVDAFVWRLFRERVLRPEHFGNRDGACLLGKAGRAEFYGAIELFLGPLGRAFRRTALILVRALTETAGQSPPEAGAEEADEDALP